MIIAMIRSPVKLAEVHLSALLPQLQLQLLDQPGVALPLDVGEGPQTH